MGFTLDAMRLPLKALGFEIIEELAVLGIFARGKVKERKRILAKASGLGKLLTETVS